MTTRSLAPTTTLGTVFEDITQQTLTYANRLLLTAGSATSATDAANENLPTNNADARIGNFLYNEGPSAAKDEAPEITGYTVGVPTFSTQANAFTAGDTVIVARVRPSVILNAVRRVCSDWASRFPQDFPCEDIVTGSLLGPYGAFSQPVAANTFPGWTITGAGAVVTRETVIIPGPGLYSCKIVSGGGAPATLTWTASELQLRQLATSSTPGSTGLGGLAMQILGLVRCGAASTDGTVTVVATDLAGTATTYTWTPTVAGRWQRLKEDINAQLATLPTVLSALTVNLNVATGTKTMYFGDMALCRPTGYYPWPTFAAGYGYRGYGGGFGQIEEYDLPLPLIGMQPIIYYETGWGTRDFRFPLDEQRGAWEIERQDATTTNVPRIRIKAQIPTGRHLRIKGYRASSVPVSASDAVEMNPGALVLLASKRVLGIISKSPEQVAQLALIDAEIARIQDPKFGSGMTFDARANMPYTVWVPNR